MELASFAVQLAASMAALVGLVFVVLQLRTAAQAARVQAWAFLLETTNSRWSQYANAEVGRAKQFALGELMNFFEVVAGDIQRKRLPRPILELMEPYWVGSIDMIARDAPLADEIRAMRVNNQTFQNLRAFCDARISRFGEYELVARLFKSRAEEALAP